MSLHYQEGYPKEKPCGNLRDRAMIQYWKQWEFELSLDLVAWDIHCKLMTSFRFEFDTLHMKSSKHIFKTTKDRIEVGIKFLHQNQQTSAKDKQINRMA